MKVLKLMITGFFVALICFTLTPSMRAGVMNQATLVTFNEPVEVPGVVLQPGTYMFTVADLPATRNVVQIFDKDQRHLYAMSMTIPEYLPDPPSKAVITFEERAADAPPAVHSWFYPGYNYGHEFLYGGSATATVQETASRTGSGRLSQSASTISISEPTSTQSSETDMLEPSAAAAEAPANPNDTPDEQAAPTSRQQPDTNADQNSSDTEQDQSMKTNPKRSKESKESMPDTASPIPELILVGLLSLGAGTSLRAMTKPSH